MNDADCAGWFYEIKEENAAVPGDGEAFVTLGQFVRWAYA